MMNRFGFLLIILTIFFSVTIFAQKINWTEFSSLNDSLKKQPRKVIVKIETDWCGYCKMMDDKIFNHKKTLRKIGEEYYFLKLNAESENEIIFRNNSYSGSKNKRGKHELALSLIGQGNNVQYPTIILLSPNLEIEKRLDGYLKRNYFMIWLMDE